MEFHERQLENGLSVIYIPDDAVPLVHIVVVSKTGATCETESTNGLAHFYEHMFFKGNAQLPDQTAYNARMRELGIVRNATTSREVVRYYVTLESSLMREGLEFMYYAITSPLFAPEEMEREREVIMNEYERNTTSPYWNLWKAQEKVLYPSAPWRGNTIGDPEVIMSASGEAMNHFRNTYYTPENCALILAGDVDPETDHDLIAGFFSDWEYGGRSDYEQLPLLIDLDRDTLVHLSTPADIAYVNVVYAGPPVKQDRHATYGGDVWGSYLSLLSGEFHRDLVIEGPFVEAHGSYYTQRFAPTITFGGPLPPDRVEEGLDLLLEEIDQLTSGGYYTLGGLELARESLRRERLLSEESLRSLVIGSIPFWWAVWGDLSYYETYVDSVMKVERDDVMAFIESYIVSRPRAIFVMTPEDQS
jgi:zinc protease